jgi:Protein of unknown function (DUF2752)
MSSARAIANSMAAAGLAGAAILYRFSPQEYSFYPRCPFHALTNLDCPGCGATRAIAELLHGHIAAALHWNAAVTLLLSVLLRYFGEMYWTAVREDRIEWPCIPEPPWKIAMACVLLFGIARNLTQIIF